MKIIFRCESFPISNLVKINIERRKLLIKTFSYRSFYVLFVSFQMAQHDQFHEYL